MIDKIEKLVGELLQDEASMSETVLNKVTEIDKWLRLFNIFFSDGFNEAEWKNVSTIVHTRVTKKTIRKPLYELMKMAVGECNADKEFCDKYAGKTVNVVHSSGDYWILEDFNIPLGCWAFENED